MMEIIFFVFLLLLVGFSACVVAPYFNPLLKQVKQNKTLVSLSELSLLVPFRNEALRITPLLESLAKQHFYPKEIIFINDHSTDNTIQLIEIFKPKINCPIQIISLNETVFGKKRALLAGVQLTTSTFIHTLDADVILPPCFFKELSSTPISEMLILPVNMVSRGNLLENLFSLEHKSFQILQETFGRKTPLFASGANLFINREAYLQYNQLEKHEHYASGDDQFLLQNMCSNHREVTVIFNPRLSVNTPTPENLLGLLEQRIRWMSKNNAATNLRAKLLSLWVFLLQESFLILLIYFVSIANFHALLLLFFVKLSFETLQFVPVLLHTQSTKLLLFLPILCIIYPFYILSLLILSLCYRPLWKERSILASKR
jgi:cellulose synthase/poly-beta-1,6-N-acetylglucosamine synthase-like glycosyltransferase